jgi:hypothetical protein
MPPIPPADVGATANPQIPYFEEGWIVTPDHPGSVRLRREREPPERGMLLPLSRLSKARKLLYPYNIAIGCTVACGCARGCESQLSPAVVKRCRLRLLRQPSEAFTLVELAGIIGKFKQAGGGPITYTIPSPSPAAAAPATASPASATAGDVVVCRETFCFVWGVSINKLTSAKTLLRGLTARTAAAAVAGQAAPVIAPPLHGNTGKSYSAAAAKEVFSLAFWHQYYDAVCNRIGDDETMSPPDDVVKAQVYETLFVGWFKKRYPTAPPDHVPSLRTFRRASNNIHFKNVKKRAKHYHTKCSTCKTLAVARAHGFASGSVELLAHQAAYKQHNDDVRGFRELEAHYKMLATHQPYAHAVIYMDDTEVFRFPHFSRRERKDTAGKYRLDYVPMLVENFSNGDLAYIFSLKKHPKGGNRFCTMAYAMCRAMKDSTHDVATASTLTFITDSYSEQKCNTDWAMACTLIAEDWYEEVQFFYNVVGHTHTGIDARHKILNQDVRRGNVATLVDLKNGIQRAFRAKTPATYIMDLQLDFNGAFKHAFERLQGFTNTQLDPEVVNAFLFRRNPTTRLIELVWKPRAVIGGAWLGADGKAGTDGFVLMRHRPASPPSIVPPREQFMTDKAAKSLLSATIRKAMDAELMDGGFEWIKEAVETNSTPIHREIDRGNVSGRLGRKVELKCGGVTADYRMIDAKSLDSYLLPADDADDGDVEDARAKFWNLTDRTKQRIKEQRNLQTPAAAALPNVGLEGSRANLARRRPADAAAQLAVGAAPAAGAVGAADVVGADSGGEADGDADIDEPCGDRAAAAAGRRPPHHEGVESVASIHNALKGRRERVRQHPRKQSNQGRLHPRKQSSAPDGAASLQRPHRRRHDRWPRRRRPRG